MFTFPLQPEELFEERAVQMNAWGIPRRIIQAARARIRDTWATGPGGWSYEWTQHAEAAERRKRWLLAARLHGAARFPVAATPERQAAQARQTECFLRAASGFPVQFERRVIGVHRGGAECEVPVHLYRPGRSGELPVVVMSGGVDTHKVELHRLALIVCRLARVTVAAIDMPGTGETPGPLSSDSEWAYQGVLDALTERTGVKRGIFGISFGGHWAAKLALLGDVDAAIDLGGPVGSIPMDLEYLTRLPNGMTGIVANAMGLASMPTEAEVAKLMGAFSLSEQGMFDESVTPLPLLAVNGSCDPYIPPEETWVFGSLPGAEAWVFRDGDHCAANQLPRIVPSLLSFLRRRLHGESLRARVLDAASRRLHPPRVAPPGAPVATPPSGRPR